MGCSSDQTTVNRLYHDGLNDLLTQSLDTMASPQARLPGGMGSAR